ncbi:MAG TPA: Heimdall-CTERM domain-containing surface protein [Candidatus Thermoplasmatota archaeon]|nr:Heimdall-CTERM domain-containing surface protein [Candidatus Thermoplasmatota archaeon]
MKFRNSSIVILGLCVLLCSCYIASAETINDGTGDVWHWAETGTAWSWSGNVGDKPNIDITEVSYTVNNDKITLSLTVRGAIQSSDKVGYYLWYNSTDTYYFLSYMNGTGAGFGMKGSMNFTSSQNVTIMDNKLSVELDVLGDTSKVELWGYAVEYTNTIGDQTSEWWGDWAPNEKFAYDTGTGGSSNPGGTNGTTPDNNGSSPQSNTPGFEIILVTAAIAIALVLIRKRR